MIDIYYIYNTYFMYIIHLATPHLSFFHKPKKGVRRVFAESTFEKAHFTFQRNVKWIKLNRQSGENRG